MEIKISSPKSSREITVEVSCPSSLQEKIDTWGEEAVNSLAERMFSTDVGNRCRAMLNNAETTIEAVMKYAESAIPGMKRTPGPKKISAKSAAAAIPSMTPDELKKLLALARAALEAQGESV
jgi:hypothetical protein